MGYTTEISWADSTWNAFIGCTRVSPGCDRCYAIGVAHRFSGTANEAYAGTTVHGPDGPDWSGRLTFSEKRLLKPLSWQAPRRIFVNSLSDVFHEAATDEQIAQLFAVMAVTPRHTYMILTKRHGRMRSLLSSPGFARQVMLAATEVGGEWDAQAYVWPLPNVIGGVSVEDQKRAELRIPALLSTPLAVRMVSAEPLLGPLKLDRYVWAEPSGLAGDWPRGVDWVIVGGESGSGARRMDPSWPREIRDQCAAAGVAFQFKQTGDVLAREWGLKDKKGGDASEWPEPFPREYPQLSMSR